MIEVAGGCMHAKAYNIIIFNYVMLDEILQHSLCALTLQNCNTMIIM